MQNYLFTFQPFVCLCEVALGLTLTWTAVFHLFWNVLNQLFIFSWAGLCLLSKVYLEMPGWISELYFLMLYWISKRCSWACVCVFGGTSNVKAIYFCFNRQTKVVMLTTRSSSSRLKWHIRPLHSFWELCQEFRRREAEYWSMPVEKAKALANLPMAA